jgi:hypothetical protein
MRLASVMGGFVVLVAIGNAGCSTPDAPAERTASTTAKLMAPDPTLCAEASAQTLSDLGIAQWCAFRGQGGVYLTGYSSEGHALKGLAAQFTRDPNGQLAELHLNVNDGSNFAVHHRFGSGKITTTNTLQTGSQALVNAATRDLGTLHAAIRHVGRVQGITKLPRQNTCASNMLGSLLASFMGAGLAQAAALSLLQQTGAFVNASGASCLGFVGSGRNGVRGLPFNGNINAINAANICAVDPDPIGCRAEFGMFGGVGAPNGFSFAPNAFNSGFVGVPSFPGGANVGGGAPMGFPTGSFVPLPGGSSVFNPTNDAFSGFGDDGVPLPMPRPESAPQDDGCGGCTAFSTTDPSAPPVDPGAANGGFPPVQGFGDEPFTGGIPAPDFPADGQDPASLDPDLHPTGLGDFPTESSDPDTGEVGNFDTA